jgi:hypothetical protein
MLTEQQYVLEDFTNYAKELAKEGERIEAVVPNIHCNDNYCYYLAGVMMCSYNWQFEAEEAMRVNNRILNSPLWKALNEAPNE